MFSQSMEQLMSEPYKSYKQISKSAKQSVIQLVTSD